MVSPPTPESKTPMGASAFPADSLFSRSSACRLRSASRAGCRKNGCCACIFTIFINNAYTLFQTTKFTLFTKHAAHSVADLSQCRIGLDGLNDERHEILRACRAVFQRDQRLLHLLVVAPLPQAHQLCHLASPYFGINAH